MPQISVIIPVYNVEKYLSQCLDSVCGQTCKDIEIICINDGSTDSSPSILAEYAERDERIRIIDQDNQGAGIARNNGISVATGDYLAFIDSDDYFALDALEKMLEVAVADNSDICVCGASRYYESTDEELPTKSYLHTEYVPENKPFSGHDNEAYILNFTNMCVWNKLFKRSYIDEHRFEFSNRVVGEDRVFVAPALCLAEAISIVDEPLVTHRVGLESSLTTEGSQNPLEAYNGWLDLKAELERRNALPMDSFARKAVGALAYNLQAIPDWDTFKNAVDALQGGIAADLGVIEHEDGFYLANWHNDFARCLHEDSAEQLAVHLLNILQTRIRYTGSRTSKLASTNRRLKSRNAALIEKNDVLRDKQAALRDKNTKLKDRLEARSKEISRKEEEISELNETNRDLSETIKQQRVLIGKKNFEIEKIKDSRTYRIGHAVGAPVRLFKKAIRSLRR